MLVCYIYNLKYIYIAGFFVGIQIVYKWDYSSAFVSAVSFLLGIPRILEMNRTLGTCCDWVASALMTIRMRLIMRLLRFVAGSIIGVMGQQSYIRSLIMAKYHNQEEETQDNHGDVTVSTESKSNCSLPHLFVNFRNIYPLFLLRQV